MNHQEYDDLIKNIDSLLKMDPEKFKKIFETAFEGISVTEGETLSDYGFELYESDVYDCMREGLRVEIQFERAKLDDTQYCEWSYNLSKYRDKQSLLNTLKYWEVKHLI